MSATDTPDAQPLRKHSRADAAAPPRRYTLRFPKPETGLDQDEEWCEVFLDGAWKRFRFHDYPGIYGVPGLYERLFYKTLRCCSPRRVVSMLRDSLRDHRCPPEKLRVLDVGAGNGLVGQRLHEIGVSRIVGIDIIPEAAEAAMRDRPDLYDDYIVADLTKLTPKQRTQLESEKFNAMTSVAALGFGDIPSAAFAQAFNLVANGGWVAFNIKDEFLGGRDTTGFSRLIRAMTQQDIIELQSFRRYCHRLSIAGERLFYAAIIARKLRDVPESIVADVN